LASAGPGSTTTGRGCCSGSRSMSPSAGRQPSGQTLGTVDQK